MGGITGGSGILVLLADDRPEREADLARSARYVSFVLAAACPAILIKHLGRPERFLNMLRIIKAKSVMSLGVWGLVNFSAAATLAFAGRLARDGMLPASSRSSNRVGSPSWSWASSARSSPATPACCISATAIPVWALGKRLIPAFSVCSGVAGACALNAAILALTRIDRTRHKLERLELVASTAEMILLEAFRRHAGTAGEPMFGGARGRKLRSVDRNRPASSHPRC